MAQTTELYDALEQTIPAVREEFEDHLHDLVEIPTISMDPAHAEDIQRGAKRAAATLETFGATTEIVETPGYPVIFGQFNVNPAYPTVAIYNHMDVQPADEPEWQRDPFVARCRRQLRWRAERRGRFGAARGRSPRRLRRRVRLVSRPAPSE